MLIRDRRKLAASLLALFVVLILTGCVAVSRGDIQRATNRVSEVWRSENTQTMKAEGSRRVDLPKPDAMDVVEHALEQIGFDIVDVNNNTGVIEAERYLTDADISDEVRRIEEPRLKKILTQEIGSLGTTARIAAEGRKLNAICDIERVDGGSRITLRRIWTEYLGGRHEYFTGQIPPAALRGGIYEFWNAVDRKVSAIQENRAVVTESRKTPSEWILPPKE